MAKTAAAKTTTTETSTPATPPPVGELVFRDPRTLLESPFQHLHRDSVGDVSDLAQSMRAHGVLEPLIIRAVAKGEEVVVGHRRQAGAIAAELALVPCILRVLDDDAVLEIQVIENDNRENPPPLKQALGYEELRNRGRSPETIAEKTGRPLSYVKQRLQLCNLSKACRKALQEERVSLGVAIDLAKLPTHKLQDEGLTRVVDRHGSVLSVKEARGQLEQLMKRLGDAPFDTKDASLVPKAGSCISCPKRTGAQPDLFTEASSPQLCTDPDCYRDKLDAQFVLMSSAAKAEGRKVLPVAQAKSLFNKHGDDVYSEYRNLDSKVWTPEGKDVQVSTLLGKDTAEIVLAQNPHTGGIVKLAPQGVIDQKLRKETRASRGKNKRANNASDAAKVRDKREQEGRIAEAIATACSEAIERQGGKGETAAFAAILPELCDTFTTGCMFALRYRGVNDAGDLSTDEIEEKLLGFTKGATPESVRGMLVQIVLADRAEYMPPDQRKHLLAVAKSVRVDVKKVTKTALAALKTERAAAATKLAETKAAAARGTPPPKPAKAKAKPAKKAAKMGGRK